MNRHPETLANFNLEAITKMAMLAIAEVENDSDFEPFEGETATYLLDIFAADWRGVYIPHDIITRFDLDIDPDDAWVWEEIEAFAGEAADFLNEKINLTSKKYDVSLILGTNEFSSDWGLLLLYENK